jgi:hypothetical protein
MTLANILYKSFPNFFPGHNNYLNIKNLISEYYVKPFLGSLNPICENLPNIDISLQ